MTNSWHSFNIWPMGAKPCQIQGYKLQELNVHVNEIAAYLHLMWAEASLSRQGYDQWMLQPNFDNVLKPISLKRNEYIFSTWASSIQYLMSEIYINKGKHCEKLTSLSFPRVGTHIWLHLWLAQGLDRAPDWDRRVKICNSQPHWS